MNKIKTSIIPEYQQFAFNGSDVSLNYKAICIFAATGFFLAEDTYFNNKTALQPATDYLTDENNFIKGSEKYWDWYYEPKEISLKNATEEFAHLLEKICREELADKKVILPLSGGLDSRTLAVALPDEYDVITYSYKFKNSFDETKYGREISKLRSYAYSELTIPGGYLWKCIDELSMINKCYADFTSPRQMAVIKDVSKLGNVFFLGHWGDVLFNDMGVEDNLDESDLTKTIIKKIIKKGGIEFASSLWESWGLSGRFEDYLEERISGLLEGIKIENANSKIRAFKSIYWAPRWTSANMEIFSNYNPVMIPYYNDDMCKLICTIPERHLAGRKIQIEYIKMKNPEIARIPLQGYGRMNLYNYKKFKSKLRLPSRVLKKGKKILKENILNKKLILRNWEIQFYGTENEKHLKEHLFNNQKFSEFLSPEVVKNFYDKFLNEDVKYSHSINILLVLSMFTKYKNKFLQN